MDAQAVLEQADKLGIELRADGDSIRYRPKAAAPEAFVEALRQHKAEVMDYLRQQGSGAAASETCHLLAWAAQVSEQNLVLLERITYVEAPLRRVTTERVSWYAAQYLKTIAAAHLYQTHPKLCWGQWTPQWWREREQEALGALAALREALAQRESIGRAPA